RPADCTPTLLSTHADPLHLLPFPTRRSSDLPLQDPQVLHEDQQRASHTSRPSRSSSTRSARSSSSSCCVTKQTAPPRPGNESTSDRKSTRLNSSHQIISYAVFCLKKKKEAQQ